jgi:hypothetical protein
VSAAGWGPRSLSRLVGTVQGVKPSFVAVKALFALSCNRCAMSACDLRLADPQWKGVQADIAHIRGERPGSARYAPDMTDAERNSPENLILLCPNHHREIDLLRPARRPGRCGMARTDARGAQAEDASLRLAVTARVRKPRSPQREASYFPSCGVSPSTCIS